jgi:hypothetical protein
MAKSTQKSLELAELIRCSDAARFQIGQAHAQLRRKLDVPLRMRDSLRASPLKWLGGSLGVGFVASLLFKSRGRESKHEPVKRHRGWFVGLLLMLFSLAKPALKVYATKLLKDYLQNQLRGRSSNLYMEDRRDPY